ncbi:phenolic glucoside malonyltransferase 1-like [Oryza brachyantha]|uniref:phenolic glucoside malonyltransferase 1-like n=1 Tax=Oryza brachyantha TaxID=4533 RepID=UPI001ADD5173|nr:phenolic glucoside malonyltransferase 1-like [Oryza brachyantha]
MAPPLEAHAAAGLRIVRTARIAPAPPAGEPALTEQALPLTFMDVLWLSAPPVERVFFYRLRPGDGDVDAVLSRLEESLSRALHTFYPLAGRVGATPGEANRYELLYKPGDGVAFTVAEHDGAGVGVDELATDELRELAKITPFVPKLPKGGAVLALQATVLPPKRRGLALGVTVHHSACDGVGSTHFLHTWAAACAGDRAMPKPPVMDRTLIRDRNNMLDVFVSPTNEAKELFTAPVAGKLLATFTLSRELLQGVKDAVAGEAARRSVPAPRCTSLVATYGLMWLCFRRAIAGGGEAEPRHDDGLAHLVFAIDHRSRLEPRIPDRYFGNCVGPGFAAVPIKELAAAGATVADGVFAACAAVAAAIDEAVRGEPGYWERWLERIVEACRDESPFSVAGSTRFCVYGMDFGFGRPAKVEIVSVAKTGAMSVAEERSGSGGIEAGIALPPEQMDTFRSSLAEAIAWLSSSSQCN